MPTEPKPVGQVSRFSLLINPNGDSKDDEPSEDSTHGDSDLELTIQKDDWLPRETKTNSKKKKKERKRSEKSDKKSDSHTLNSERTTKSIKTEKCQKETIKPTIKPTQKQTPTPSDSTSTSQSKNSAKNSKKFEKNIPSKINPPPHCLSAEEDVKTPTSSSLDQDFLKTSQNLDLEEFRKSLEQINSGFEGNGILGNCRNGSISSLGQSDDSICDKTCVNDGVTGVTDLSLYSIQGTISNLQGKLIQGLKGIESKEFCLEIYYILRISGLETLNKQINKQV